MLLFCLVIAIASCYLLANNDGRTRSTPPPTSISTAPAKESRLIEQGVSCTIVKPRGQFPKTAVYLALERTDFDALVDAEHDIAGGGPGAGAAMERLIAAGKATFVTVGSHVRVVKGYASPLRVQVLDGEDKGTFGWVQKEFLEAL